MNAPRIYLSFLFVLPKASSIVTILKLSLTLVVSFKKMYNHPTPWKNETYGGYYMF
jgi:hypothetical protein